MDKGNDAKDSGVQRDESQASSELKAGFTPGPWRVIPNTDEEYAEVVDVVADAHRHLICYTPTVDNGDCRANAHLIAAAPDMYAAMRAIRDKHDAKAHYYHFGRCGCEDCKACDDALALAGGNQQ